MFGVASSRTRQPMAASGIAEGRHSFHPAGPGHPARPVVEHPRQRDLHRRRGSGQWPRNTLIRWHGRHISTPPMWRWSSPSSFSVCSDTEPLDQMVGSVAVDDGDIRDLDRRRTADSVGAELIELVVGFMRIAIFNAIALRSRFQMTLHGRGAGTSRLSCGPISGGSWSRPPEILIFALFMIPDPRTVPDEARWRGPCRSPRRAAAVLLLGQKTTLEFWTKTAILEAWSSACAGRFALARCWLARRRRQALGPSFRHKVGGCRPAGGRGGFAGALQCQPRSRPTARRTRPSSRTGRRRRSRSKVGSGPANRRLGLHHRGRRLSPSGIQPRSPPRPGCGTFHDATGEPGGERDQLQTPNITQQLAADGGDTFSTLIESEDAARS